MGYTVPSSNLVDIANNWAKESIDYVVSRGLLSSISKTTFEPNSIMTYGKLLTALGKLSGMDENVLKNNQLTDDQAITREEIALLFLNYAKATGYKLPVTCEVVSYADDSSIGSDYKDAITAM